MVFTIGRKNTSRASLLYCANTCGPSGQVLGKHQNDGWNSTINPYGRSVSSKVASYAALVRGGIGGKPTWSFAVSKKKYGLANPPDIPEDYINQYGRLKGTGGQPLRNF